MGKNLKSANRRDDHREVIAWLQEYFPNAFPYVKKHIKPLKLGIIDDILAFYERLDTQPYSKKKIRLALAYYTQSPQYLTAQVAGSQRIDLYGEIVEAVTDEQAQYAQEKYKQRYARKHHQPRDKV